MCTILFWLGPNNIDHCLQLGALNALEEVMDFGAIVHSTVAITCKAPHDGVLFLVECNILIPIPPFHLTIKVRGLQLSFCIFGLPGHMIRAEELLVGIKEHSLAILCTLSLFHIDICIHVLEYFQENLIHQGTVNVECITLVVKVDSVLAVLIQHEVQLYVNNGGCSFSMFS